jgi:AcrR family transcriptional regulator
MPDDTGSPTTAPSSERPLRADARQNRVRVLAAATDVLSEVGMKAPVEEIARRAGVGVGTVCRHFPTKQELVDAVLVTLYEQLLVDGHDALANPDAGEAFESYVVAQVAFQADHLALAEQMARPLEPEGPRGSVRLQLRAVISELLARAQAAGQVRADVGAADVSLLLSGIANATAQAGGPIGRELTDRYLAILLDGLRPAGASALPGQALSFETFERLRAGQSAEAATSTQAEAAAGTRAQADAAPANAEPQAQAEAAAGARAEAAAGTRADAAAGTQAQADAVPAEVEPQAQAGA